MGFSWFSSRINPIGVDFGNDSIKMLQLEPRENQLRLIAAASTEVPDNVRQSTRDYETFAVDAIKKMTHEFGFRGRQIVTCLPARDMHVLHLRVPKLTPDEMKKALPFEAQGKLPFDPHKAVLRHIISGEVYQRQETKTEVILMAAARENVERQLEIVNRAKLETVGIHIEPMALVECFSHLFRRTTDAELSTMFVDIGSSHTHVVITHGRSVVFTKYINIAGTAFNQAAAAAMQCAPSAARATRWRWAAGDNAPEEAAGTLAIGGRNAPIRAIGGEDSNVATMTEPTDQRQAVGRAVGDHVDTLLNELELCVRYYDSTFSGKPINRAIFVGGESRNIEICQRLAQQLNVPATLGDPLSRLLKDAKTQCAVDMRQPQPGWAVAVGLAAGLRNTRE